jgi:hypothetical protein
LCASAAAMLRMAPTGRVNGIGRASAYRPAQAVVGDHACDRHAWVGAGRRGHHPPVVRCRC